jgi:hypothetical protein
VESPQAKPKSKKCELQVDGEWEFKGEKQGKGFFQLGRTRLYFDDIHSMEKVKKQQSM